MHTDMRNIHTSYVHPSFSNTHAHTRLVRIQCARNRRFTFSQVFWSRTFFFVSPSQEFSKIHVHKRSDVLFLFSLRMKIAEISEKYPEKEFASLFPEAFVKSLLYRCCFIVPFTFIEFRYFLTPRVRVLTSYKLIW